MYQRFTPHAPGDRSSGYGAHPGRAGWTGEYRGEYSWETIERPPQGRLATAVQIAIMLAAGPVMHRFVGPPRLPAPWQDLWRGLLALLDGHRIWSFLTGPGPTYVDIAQVAPWVFLVFWLLWLYVVVVVALQAALALADLVTRGAAWVRSLQAVVDRVTLPQLRRLAHGAVVATAVMQLTARPAGADSGLQPPTAAAVVLPDPDFAAAAADAAQPAETERVAKYTVVSGDNLWEIAERFYGSGWDHTRIVDANEGRRMADGRMFSGRASTIIHPGWVLDLPMPDVRIEQREGHTEYVIQPSETLAGIATRFLGDEYRWPEIYEPNRASAANLWSVGASTRADQVWPQRRIVLPAALLREATESAEAIGGPSGFEAPQSNSREPSEPAHGAIRMVALPESAFDGGNAAPDTVAPPAALAVDSRALGDGMSGSGAAEAAETAGVRTVGTGPLPAPPPPPPPPPPLPLFPSPAAALAGAAFSVGALAGGTTVLASRRLRRSLDEPPVRLVPAQPEQPRRATLKPSRRSISTFAPATPTGRTPSGVAGTLEFPLPNTWPAAPAAPAAPPRVGHTDGGSGPARQQQPDQPAAVGPFGISEAASPASRADDAVPRAPEASMAAGASAHALPVSQPPPLAVGEARASHEVRIWLQCFGGLRVTARTSEGERELSHQAGGTAHHKPWAILVYLACQPGGAAPADKILDTFWDGETDPRDSNRVLRVSLARLRKLIRSQVPGLPGDAEIVRSERDGIRRLDARHVGSDVQRFAELCERAATLPPDQALPLYEEAFHLYRGDLLVDSQFTWIHERVFDGDGLTPRERLREAYRRVVNALAVLYRRGGRIGEAIVLYEGLLRAEPTLEAVSRELYRCYEQLEDLPSLLRTHARLRRALRESFGEEGTIDAAHCAPQPETERVFRQVEEALRKRAVGEGTRGTQANRLAA